MANTRRRTRGGARRRRTTAETARRATPPPEPPTPELPAPEPPAPEPPAAEPELTLAEPEIPDAEPERAFAARVPPPEPERPLPASRRAIFLDVENTSRAEHIARTIDHLGIDRLGRRTEFVAVGNWRVIGADTARLLARHGAQLIHSAPSTGVRDWSDLRIAVSAGVWLAAARPGDVLEIVSEDRAFDAVGDVAATLGIAFRRLSYRALAGAPASAAVREVEDAPVGPRDRHGRHRGRRGRGAPRSQPALHAVEPRHPEPSRHREPVRHHEPVRPPEAVRADGDAHTAPHDEIVGVVRELVERVPDRAILIDTLANALKGRGFRRTPGSPRLITRLRRIKELDVSPTGMIKLVGGVPEAPEPWGDAPEPPPVEEVATEAVAPAVAEAPAGEGAQPDGPRRRRRSRRRGRGRRRAAVTQPAAD